MAVSGSGSRRRSADAKGAPNGIVPAPPRLRLGPTPCPVPDACLVPFALPLRAPLRLATGVLTERRGVLLRLGGGDGRVGWGECAPFPGLSPDTSEVAEASLQTWIDRRDDTVLTPAARAAVDGARLDLDAQRRGVSLARALAPGAAASVPLAALLAGDDAAVVAKASGLRRAGYAAAKLKVGGPAVDADVRRIRAVADALGPDVALRLDANRAWSFDDARRVADALAGIALDYLEEPLADATHLDAFVADTGLRVALDESLTDIVSPDTLARHAYAHAVVLKPLVLGGVVQAFAWGRAAQAAGLVPVVSSAFESGVGTRLAIALAAALGDIGAPAPAGLDPYSHLAADVLAPRLPLDGPLVDVEAALAGSHVAV